MKRIKQNLSIEQANRLFIQLPSGQIVFATNAQMMMRIQLQLIAHGIIDSMLVVSETSNLWSID